MVATVFGKVTKVMFLSFFILKSYIIWSCGVDGKVIHSSQSIRQESQNLDNVLRVWASCFQR